jgi:hypothetical protein
MQVPIPGYGRTKLKIINKRTSLLPKSRQELVEEARKKQCSYGLFIDTDQTFASDLLHRLMAWKKPVVACNVATKSLPASPTARNRNPNYFGGDMVYTDPESSGLQQVWRIGTGVMLLDLSIFDKIEKPWFPVRWQEKDNEWVGEDWNFCEILEAAGVPIFIDHDASQDVGHIGQLIYDHSLVGAVEKRAVA